MKNRIKILSAKLWLLFLIGFPLSLYPAEKLPFYDWAAGIQIGYFNPLGYYRDLINPAYGVQLNARVNPNLLDYFLIEGSAGIIFSNFKNNTPEKYYFLPIGVSGVYQIPLWNGFFLEPKLGGGYYFMKIQSDWFNNFFASGGMGLSYRLYENLELRLNQDFMVLADKDQRLFASYTGLSFQYAFGQPSSEKDIKILSFEIEKLFAALYPYYYKNSVGAVRFKNSSGEDLKNISVSLYLKEFMDEKTVSRIKPPALKKNESLIVPVYAFFLEKIKRMESDLQTTAILEIEYEKGNQKHRKKELIPLKIYHKNAIIWDNLLKLGSFASVQDQSLLQFSRRILYVLKNTGNQTGFHDFSSLVQIMQGLKIYSLAYVKDPNTPYENFSGQKASADTIQYPRETLLKKTGDCDDLTVLLSALLEGVGIPTAFVSVPGHIFLLAEAKEIDYAQNLVDYAGKKWIPLEATALSEGFLSVWQKGYENYQKASEKQIILTSDAISRFIPIIFDEPLEFNLDMRALEQSYLKEMEEVKTLLKQSLSFSKNLENESASALNQKGVRYAEAGDLIQAEQYYKKAVKKDKKYKNAYYNLVVLYELKKEYHKAKDVFNDFRLYYPEDEQMNGLMEKIRLELNKDKNAPAKTKEEFLSR